MRPYSDEDLAAARAVLKHLTDRGALAWVDGSPRAMPDWLAEEVAKLIADHRGVARGSKLATVQRAEVALKELELSALTAADKERCGRAYAGLKALDDVQQDFKLAVEDLLEEYENPNAPDDDCVRLIADLRKAAARLPAGRAVTSVKDVYRAPAEIDLYEPAKEKRAMPWKRIVGTFLVMQGPLVAGLAHDANTPPREGACWAVALVALGVSISVLLAFLASLARRIP